MRNVRKKVMLDLVIQPAGEPGCHPRLSGEVSGRAKLVHGPVVLRSNASKFHAGREMRKLEDYRQYPAEDQVKKDECGEGPYQRQNQEGQHDKEEKYKPLQMKNSARSLLFSLSRCH